MFVSHTELARLSRLPGAIVTRTPHGEIERVRVARNGLESFAVGAEWGMWIGIGVGIVAGMALTLPQPGNRSGACPSNMDCDAAKFLVPMLFGMAGGSMGGLIGGGIGVRRDVQPTFAEAP